jgi:hypothetical protein
MEIRLARRIAVRVAAGSQVVLEFRPSDGWNVGFDLLSYLVDCK